MLTTDQQTGKDHSLAVKGVSVLRDLSKSNVLKKRQRSIKSCFYLLLDRPFIDDPQAGSISFY